MEPLEWIAAIALTYWVTKDIKVFRKAQHVKPSRQQGDK